MKKKKILIINIIIALLLIPTYTFAIDTSQYEPTSPADYSEFTDIGGNVISIIQYVGIIAGAIVLTIIGIKYMLGSVEEKAEYKKSMMPYIVGCAFLISSSSIVGIINNVLDEEKTETSDEEKTETSEETLRFGWEIVGSTENTCKYCTMCGKEITTFGEKLFQKCVDCEKNKGQIQYHNFCKTCGKRITSNEERHNLECNDCHDK